MYYETSKDWSGGLYCGINLNWNYDKRTLDISMPGYVEEALHKFQHSPTTKVQDCPYKLHKKQYGVKVQLMEAPDRSEKLGKKGTNRVQQIVDTFLFYARAVNPTMLVVLKALSMQQAQATQAIAAAIQQFLDYCHTHPDSKIHYKALDMVLRIYSNASYQSVQLNWRPLLLNQSQRQ